MDPDAPQGDVPVTPPGTPDEDAPVIAPPEPVQQPPVGDAVPTLEPDDDASPVIVSTSTTPSEPFDLLEWDGKLLEVMFEDKVVETYKREILISLHILDK